MSEDIPFMLTKARRQSILYIPLAAHTNKHLGSNRMTLQQLVDGIRPQRRIRKQGANKVDQLIDLKVNQCAFLEQIRDVRDRRFLRGSSVRHATTQV